MQKSASAWIGNWPPRQIIGTRRPPSTPASASSLMPSGSGITAATVMAGGPPTKMFTRSVSLRRSAAA